MKGTALCKVMINGEGTCMPVRCYPCSVHGYPCVMETAPLAVVRAPTYREWLRDALGAPDPGNHWFDVALWRYGVGSLFPRYEGYMQAPSAFLAIEEMMRYYRLWSVSYASSRALEDSLVYRAWGVHIFFLLSEEEEEVTCE